MDGESATVRKAAGGEEGIRVADENAAEKPGFQGEGRLPPLGRLSAGQSKPPLTWLVSL